MEARPSSLSYLEPVSPGLETALRRFASISLEDMNSVSLMRRVDTKYIIDRTQLPRVLDAVRNHYAILEIDGRRAMRYCSQYFDTANRMFFNDHHNRQAKRAKVRIRSYVDSGLSFIEIKQKSVKGVTRKRRVRFPSPLPDEELSPAARRFIDEVIDSQADPRSRRRIARGDELQPTIRNRFRRITLVDSNRGERVTVDWDLTSLFAYDCFEHENLVIIEVKQEGHDRHAPVMEVLKAIGARPIRVSKYCLGMICLCPELKANRFKNKLLRIDRFGAATTN